MSEARGAVLRARIVKIQSRTSGNGRYFGHTLEDRAENKWDVHVAHGKSGSNRFFYGDAFRTVGILEYVMFVVHERNKNEIEKFVKCNDGINNDILIL